MYMPMYTSRVCVYVCGAMLHISDDMGFRMYMDMSRSRSRSMSMSISVDITDRIGHKCIHGEILFLENTAAVNQNAKSIKKHSFL